MMKKVLCNICQKNFSKVLFKIKDPEGMEFDMVRCQGCNLVYMNPRFEPREIEDFYNENYFAFDDIKQVRQIKYAVEAIEEITEFKREGRLLDIGSAKGLFLLVARKYGFEVEGLEISKYAAEFTQEAFGIYTTAGTIDEVDYPENHFDVITMYDVLEHFQNPLENMLKIRKILKDDGILMVDTPNFGSIFSKFRGKKWPGYGIYHLYCFSNNTIDRLLSMAGFRAISSRSGKNSIFSFDALWRWGLISYRAYTRLEQIFVLSKLSSEVRAPIKKMYENGEVSEVNAIVDKQVSEILNGHSVVNEMLKYLNYPLNRLIERRFAGDSLRIIAKKKIS